MSHRYLGSVGPGLLHPQFRMSALPPFDNLPLDHLNLLLLLDNDILILPHDILCPLPGYLPCYRIKQVYRRYSKSLLSRTSLNTSHTSPCWIFSKSTSSLVAVSTYCLTFCSTLSFSTIYFPTRLDDFAAVTKVELRPKAFTDRC